MQLRMGDVAAADSMVASAYLLAHGSKRTMVSTSQSLLTVSSFWSSFVPAFLPGYRGIVRLQAL
jgi:hypothetical protein